MPDSTEIPTDAKTAQTHAAPLDLGNLPSEATPSVNGNTPQAEQRDLPSGGYESPEPVEVLFAQLRDDFRRNEKLLMLTATTVVFMGLLFAYYIRKNGGLSVAEG